MKLIKYAVMSLASFSVSAYSMADRKSPQFQVKIQVVEICNVGTGSTSDLDFGSVTRNEQNLRTSGSLNVHCTNGTPYSIALKSHGTLKHNNDASIQIPYQLYQDASMSKKWGDIVEDRFSHQGTGQIQNITIWGLVPNTNVPAGQYTDNVTATITY